MAHSNCGWTCGCADKTVKSLENTCHTWALLGWCFTKRRYIKCTYSTCVPLPCCMQCTGSFDASMLVHAAVIRHFINNLCMREREREWVRGGGVETACHSWCLWVTCAGVTTVLCLSATGWRGAARRCHCVSKQLKCAARLHLLRRWLQHYSALIRPRYDHGLSVWAAALRPT